ncbi:MAG: hypothetical protein WAQ53_14350 [Thiofilum sp.]|uniref:hypothetical protein n=1 Tax=Thiofilum sp. TaxID=2212733 RepID=UPI0025FFAE2C|nr:hypothetical protein [Thiofilum sp.]MBK8453508.1 hypothetical protein [Thiofilum sp.]
MSSCCSEDVANLDKLDWTEIFLYTNDTFQQVVKEYDKYPEILEKFRIKEIYYNDKVFNTHLKIPSFITTDDFSTALSEIMQKTENRVKKFIYAQYTNPETNNPIIPKDVIDNLYLSTAIISTRQLTSNPCNGGRKKCKNCPEDQPVYVCC